MRVIHWFRRDLRISDNTALNHACEIGDEVIGLVILNEKAIKKPGSNSLRMRVLLGYINALRETMISIGGSLVIRFGNPDKVLKDVCAEWKANVVTWNEDIEHSSSRRDKNIEKSIKDLGVEVKTLPDRYVVSPIMDVDEDKSFPSFEDFYVTWSDEVKKVSDPVWKPDKIPLQAGTAEVPLSEELPSPDKLGYAEAEFLPKQGEEVALQRLRVWIEAVLPEWGNFVYELDEHYYSCISTDLRFGVLSPRICINMIKPSLESSDFRISESAEKWLEGLGQRDYYAHLLHVFPQLMDEPYYSDYDVIKWDKNENFFYHWKNGTTGFPLVDAAMRQLKTQGHIPFIAREVAASCLVKLLFLDWRIGVQYFSQQLLDSDVAINAGNWQRISSMGPDADPYWSWKDPVKTAHQCDPFGIYVRRWIPELRRVPLPYLHAPWELPRNLQEDLDIKIGRDYPRPVVNMDKRREEVMIKYRYAGLGGNGE